MAARMFKFRDTNKPPPTINPLDPICPCCDYQGPFKSPQFRNQQVQCPNCSSLERQRFVHLSWTKYIKQYVSENLNILHIAKDICIQPLFKKHAKSPGSYRCCELDPVKRGVLNIDITRIPPSIHSIDLIYTSHVLEHIVDDAKALSEIYRVLKPNGIAVILVPQKFTLEKTYEDATIVSPEQRLKHFGDKDHVRYYGLDFIDRLTNTGFTVDVLTPRSFTHQFPSARNIIHCTDEADEKKYNLSVNDIIYLCFKPALSTV
jgi:SAM-dependent methyltransferase